MYGMRMPHPFKNNQPEINFDSLFQTLSDEFELLPDHRRANSSYKLADVLRSAFAMFSLKSPSLLSFRQQTKQERHNLQNIYHITDIPSDTQMRAILDPISPLPLRALFAKLFDTLRQSGVIKQYLFWRKYLIVSIDGVEHFCSTKIHCDHCCTRTLRNGTTSYHHSGLAAVLVHPNHEEFFPLDFEPILKPDGTQKNDCERNAAKRLCEALHDRYPGISILLVEDALYANAPHIRQITDYNWKYILNVKPDSHQSLEKQFAGRLVRGQVKERQHVDEKGVHHRYL